MYEEYKKYGVYKNNCGRSFLILICGNKRKTISYPRYLLECHINRELLPEEDVHHIDGDFENNEINNLEIINHKKHCQSHAVKYLEDLIYKCEWCGNEFEIKKENIAKFLVQEKRSKSGKHFCSKKCVGNYGAYIQNKKQ